MADTARQTAGAFTKRSKVEFGFGWLVTQGKVDEQHALELWINCRMVLCLALQAGFGSASTTVSTLCEGHYWS